MNLGRSAETPATVLRPELPFKNAHGLHHLAPMHVVSDIFFASQ